MKKRRLFIAINLPQEIKKKLLDFQAQWADLPVRWAKENNLHLTLIFIGYVADEEMVEICRLARQVGQKEQSFEIRFNKICLGPPGKPARLIWLEGEANPALAKLKNNLEKMLFQSDKSGFNHLEKRLYRPHITLARIKHREWRQMALAPNLERQVDYSFAVNSIEVMESHLSRQGAEYIVLESVEFKE